MCPHTPGEMLQDFRLRALNGLLAKKLQGLKADNTRRDGDIGRGDN